MLALFANKRKTPWVGRGVVLSGGKLTLRVHLRAATDRGDCQQLDFIINLTHAHTWHFLQADGLYIPNYTASYPRRP